jgi:hypothetical protein
MKAITKVVRSFKCEKCGTEYRRRWQALACERRPIEKPAFKKGDRVRAKEKRTCFNDKRYVMIGRITGYTPVEPADEDYENRHLGGKPSRMNSHVRRYGVTWICPVCKSEKGTTFYAPELEKISAR